MIQKLGLKDFGSARLAELGISCFSSFIYYPEDDAIDILGEVMGKKFMQRIKEIKETPMYDYILIGAIGFSNIAAETWKKILSKVHLNDFLADNDDVLASKLSAIKGVGPETINTIIEERPMFAPDLICMIKDCNVISTFGAEQNSKGKIRITGFRDPELMEYLNSLGYDASDSGVTKDTSVLLIPYEGFSSSKIQKAEKYGVRIMTKDDFIKEVRL
jgi:NAD-dependent DNA ligase